MVARNDTTIAAATTEATDATDPTDATEEHG